jgi:hypothetical protein
VLLAPTTVDRMKELASSGEVRNTFPFLRRRLAELTSSPGENDTAFNNLLLPRRIQRFNHFFTTTALSAAL